MVFGTILNYHNPMSSSHRESGSCAEPKNARAESRVTVDPQFVERNVISRAKRREQRLGTVVVFLPSLVYSIPVSLSIVFVLSYLGCCPDLECHYSIQFPHVNIYAIVFSHITTSDWFQQEDKRRVCLCRVSVPLRANVHKAR